MNVFIREFLILFTYRLHFVAKRDTLEINICSQLGRSKVADTEHTKQKITIWIFFFYFRKNYAFANEKFNQRFNWWLRGEQLGNIGKSVKCTEHKHCTVSLFLTSTGLNGPHQDKFLCMLNRLTLKNSSCQKMYLSSHVPVEIILLSLFTQGHSF